MGDEKGMRKNSIKKWLAGAVCLGMTISMCGCTELELIATILQQVVEQNQSTEVIVEQVETLAPETSVPVQLPLTEDEVRMILEELGYGSNIVIEVVDGKYQVMTYEYTYLSYTMMVDAVSGVAEVSVQFGDPIGAIDLRTKSVLNGTPLPCVETSAENIWETALSREYVEQQLAAMGLGKYQIYSETDTTFELNETDLGWFMTVYRYSGQVIEYNFRGVIVNEYQIPAPPVE